ncbi:hypothetical protein BA768_04670 [Chryseobacterium sp. CBo1]|uniref:hypothetical protein n=1 Tax=Chryseobacterium sp. CBo1 TaxID=1869230 RepID=UPI000810CA27|nr:hypothetical protein [Chryseobacterium sp. CBo1]OCK50453.1 hypothetical protein BA768_04670 [Chryseobacterium sp. CBo1]
MKNILIILFSLLIYNNSFAQKKSDNVSKLQGTWVGKAEEDSIKFEFFKTPKFFTFSYMNSNNEKFIVKKSDIVVNDKREIIINIKKANLSSEKWKKCLFSAGIITISNLSENLITLNLKSVGPICNITEDESLLIEDIDNIQLIKQIK